MADRRRIPPRAWFIPISNNPLSQEEAIESDLSSTTNSFHSASNSNGSPMMAQNEGTQYVSIKIPPFWPKDPELWFHQVDAQFAAKGITNTKTKYNHIVAAISPDIAALVRELIQSPPADDPYKALKDRIIERTGPTRQQQIHELLRPQSVGDRRPSVMLQEMKQQMGQDAGDLLRELFLKRLPQNMSLMLSAFPNDTIDELARKADGMYNSIAAKPTPVIHIPDSNAIDNVNDPDLCWFHNRFGEKARSCRPPCKLQPGIGSQSTENKTAGRM